MGLDDLLTLDDAERLARSAMDPATWAYVAGGAGAGSTIEGNRRAFGSTYLRPRVLKGARAAEPRLDVTLFGRRSPLPVLLAPTSPQRLVHPRAELETADAAAARGLVSIVSTDSHHPFEAICAASRADCWFQLYSYRSRDDVEATIDYATRSGASALVVTVDADYPARRIAARRAGFCAPPDIDFGTLRALGVFDGAAPAEARLERLPLNWDDLAWIRRRTRAPLLLKGVLGAEDARAALDCGVDGLIVSNHGGRQLDGVVPSLVALRDVAVAVGGRCPLLVDGGVRSGLDVVRALAQGADAVCIGRPYLWGLALDGARGVVAILDLLAEELRDALRQLGLDGVADVSSACLAASGNVGLEPKPAGDLHVQPEAA